MKKLELKVVTLNTGPLQMAINILKDSLYDFTYLGDDNYYHTFSFRLCNHDDEELILISYKDILDILDDFIDNSLLNVLSKAYKREYISRKKSFMKEYEELMMNMYLNESYNAGGKVLCLNLDGKDISKALLDKDYFFTTICKKIRGKEGFYSALDEEGCYILLRDFKHMEKGDKKVFIAYSDAYDYLLESKDINMKRNELKKVLSTLKDEFVKFINEEMKA